MYKSKIVRLADECAGSYREEHPLHRGEITLIIDDAERGVYAVIRRREEELLIIFRGTVSKREWISNFRVIKKCVPYDNTESKIRVHTGFINTYKAVREKLLTLIDASVRKITLTGHSRGAAMATLCAVDFQYNFPDREIEVYCYGSPKVGNRAFADSYNKRVTKTVRIETRGDIIPKLPPFIFGYRHVGMGFQIPSPPFSEPHHYLSYIEGLIYTTEMGSACSMLPIV